MIDNRDAQNQGLQQQPDDALRRQADQQNQQADRRQGVDATNEDDMDGGQVTCGKGDIRPDRTDDGGAQR